MPIIHSTYKAPYFLFSEHLETIIPALFRKNEPVKYQRERIDTPDQDFLDLDWSFKGSDTLILLSHGLEGNSKTQYILGMVFLLNSLGYDTLSWNYRGCSGEINKLHRFYHSGETGDLDFVIEHAIRKKNYSKVVLIGFSIGGNITLKYLGEQGNNLKPQITCSVNFSVPCHLASGAKKLARWGSYVYMKRFLTSLEKKITEKSRIMPEVISAKGFDKIRNFLEFDELYTAPIHGFKNAFEYWEECSSLYYLKNIRIPTLLVNACNDPFLTPQCFPINEAEENPYLFLEMPEHGGHVGFMEKKISGIYWSEKRAVEFISDYL